MANRLARKHARMYSQPYYKMREERFIRSNYPSLPTGTYYVEQSDELRGLYSGARVPMEELHKHHGR